MQKTHEDLGESDGGHLEHPSPHMIVSGMPASPRVPMATPLKNQGLSAR